MTLPPFRRVDREMARNLLSLDGTLVTVLVFATTADREAALADPKCWRCPDCHSHLSTPTRHGNGLVEVDRNHDDTCPWLLARTERTNPMNARDTHSTPPQADR